MEATVELAGYFAAHGILIVSKGGRLIPLVAVKTPESAETKVVQFVDQPYEEAVVSCRELLTRIEREGVRAVLIADGYFTLPDSKTDALILEMRKYDPGGPPQSLKMAVPYRHVAKPGEFAVFRPKFILADGDDAAAVPDRTKEGDAWKLAIDGEVNQKLELTLGELKSRFQRASDLGQAFFRGVYQHKEGGAIWDKHLDQSQ